MNLPTIASATLTFVLSAICGCGGQRADEAPRPSAATIDTRQQSATGSIPASAPSACSEAEALPRSLENIARTASTLLAGPDSCVTMMIDSLGALARRAPDRRILVAVDSLARSSDGYASEAISEMLPKIFRDSPETLTRYLLDTRLYRPQALRDALVSGFTLERATLVDPAGQLALDRQLFARVADGMTDSPDDRSYIDSLRNACLVESPLR